MHDVKQSREQRFALFAKGFRCFFLGATLLAVGSILIWVKHYSVTAWVTFHFYSPTVWHIHEMIFGYGGAVLAGFLLTAVSTWTARETLHGTALASLFAIWLTARVFPFISTVPGWIIGLLNVLFFVALAVSVAVPIILAGNKRNLFVVVVLIALAICTALVHAQLLNITETGLTTALHLAFYIFLMLIVIFAGRVFPMFSSRGVAKPYEPIKRRWLEILAIVSFIGFVAVALTPVPPLLRAAVAMIAVVAHSIRVAGWYNHQIVSVPLVWVLHLGYYFLIIGMFFIGISGFYPYLRVPGLHAMLVGGFGLITMGMMARVSLGHTGRNVHEPPFLLPVLFLGVALAASVRAFLPLVEPSLYLFAINASGFLWALAFLGFTVLYAPLLLKPRVDGAPG